MISSRTWHPLSVPRLTRLRLYPDVYRNTRSVPGLLRTITSVSISRKVQDALRKNQAVVCLESTIITHGMEYPANLRMAKAVEAVIEENGATPATIAFVNGVAHVGLEASDLELLARTGRQARKISRRDMAACIADAATGGTTVSGTMILARLAGIKVFVTGGIGGVHREAETTMDISNDLNELSRNDVAVVCAGPKAILDIPLTLEYLETMGVTVTTVGQQNLPAFYSRDSGIESPQVSPSAEHAARLISANRQLKLGSSVLVCVPIPEEASIDGEEMRLVIDAALQQAKNAGIRGKDSTPFLLAAVSEATKGRSLEANIQLVLENARIGAQIAVQLAAIDPTERTTNVLVHEELPSRFEYENLDAEQSQIIADSLSELEMGFSLHDLPQEESPPMKTSNDSDILIVGGVAVDVSCNIKAPIASVQDLLYTSTPGKVTRSIGGVAGNIARAVVGTGTPATLVSVIGAAPAAESNIATRSGPEADTDGQFVLEELRNSGLDVLVHPVSEATTATYTAVQANGELLVAVADMDIFVDASKSLYEKLPRKNYKAIIYDANIPGSLGLITSGNSTAKVVCFEPTSVSKAASFFDDKSKDGSRIDARLQVWPENIVTMTTPNVHELRAMFLAAQSSGQFEGEEWWSVINSLNIAADFRNRLELFLRKHREISLKVADLGMVQQAIHLLPFVENIYLTMGSSGVLSFHLARSIMQPSTKSSDNFLTQDGQDCALTIIYHPPITGLESLVNDTGAGDTFTGVLVSCLTKGHGIPESVTLAQRAAILTLQSSESVSPHIRTLF